MAKYNIYKIKSNRLAQVQNLLTIKGYRLVSETESNNFKMEAYFTPSPTPTDIWWLEQYASFFEGFADRKNKIYSGAILAYNSFDKSIYLIALGKTHFYIQPHIELDFGLNLAEKIANPGSAKTKSTKKFAGNTSKAITSYMMNSPLRFASGEAAEYVKLQATDTNIWGKSFIHFGTSVHFSSITTEPEHIGTLLNRIGINLNDKENSGVRLPRMLAIKDPAQIKYLDEKLAESVLNGDISNSIGIHDYELYGTDFVFSQATQVKLRYKENNSNNVFTSELLPELSFEAIREFFQNHTLDIKNTLRDVRVQVFVDEKSKFSINLVNLLDYLSDEQLFLFRGKWYFFNKSFIESLQSEVDKIHFERSSTIYKRSEHQKWVVNNPSEKVNYPEKYLLNELESQNPQYLQNDRELDYKHVNGKNYSIEVSDLINENSQEIVIVKIGNPKDFSYAANQSLLTISQIINNKYTYEKDNRKIEIKNLTLYLATKNKTLPEKLSGFNSLNFLIQLNELSINATEKNIKLKVILTQYTDN